MLNAVPVPAIIDTLLRVAPMNAVSDVGWNLFPAVLSVAMVLPPWCRTARQSFSFGFSDLALAVS